MATICAVATAWQKASIGIVRLSGTQALSIANCLVEKPLKPQINYRKLYASKEHLIDQALVLYFQAPHSFTGEDVVEFHCHGAMVVLESLIQALLQKGAVLAEPGEFSQRAFLNGKLDLSQAEAICDLINAQDSLEARAALGSLSGVFAEKVQNLHQKFLQLRVILESGLDFSDEEIDILQDYQVFAHLEQLRIELGQLLVQSSQTLSLRKHHKVVLYGPTNVGKSSLLNALSQQNRAIVSPIAGTTRDVIEQELRFSSHFDQQNLTLVDTAGIHDSTNDPIEQQGILRSHQALADSDRVILVADATLFVCNQQKDFLAKITTFLQLFLGKLGKMPNHTVILVMNKADLLSKSQQVRLQNQLQHLDLLKNKVENLNIQAGFLVSAEQKMGLVELKSAMMKSFQNHQGQQGQASPFLARKRHLETLQAVDSMLEDLQQSKDIYPEIIAQKLKDAHDLLGTISGKVSTEELLGSIFSSFCIGK